MLSQEALLPLPPRELVARVSGSPEIDQFEASGAQTVREWSDSLRAVGKTFKDFNRIADFGCGCGRVLRHLRPKLDAHQELIGLDVDSEAIAWIREAYPTIRAESLNQLPPANIEGGSIDLIVNHSVFTHLPEDVQFAWLAELHRMLRPGGVAVLTFHGRKVWTDFCASLVNRNRSDVVPVFTERFNRCGFFYLKGRNELEQALPEYYGSAFHTISYIEAEWLRYFKLRAWLPVRALAHQDIVVLEK